jgi:hypothetical protein
MKRINVALMVMAAAALAAVLFAVSATAKFNTNPDVTFAFVFNAFHPKGVINTK